MKKTHSILLASSTLLLTSALSQGVGVVVDSNKESHIREDAANINVNQGQTRLIFGAQGSAASEFRVMMQFQLTDLVTSSGGGPITINSVTLDLGDAFTWSAAVPFTSSSFELRAWNVADFDVADNTWNDPQGSLGADGAGGTLGSVLSTETFSNATAEGDFIFGSEAGFVSFIQSAYDSDTLSGATINVLAVMEDDGTFENTIPRTDGGLVTGINTGDLNIDYTPVPEPSSTALLGLGGLALILRRRK